MDLSLFQEIRSLISDLFLAFERHIIWMLEDIKSLMFIFKLIKVGKKIQTDL